MDSLPSSNEENEYMRNMDKFGQRILPFIALALLLSLVIVEISSAIDYNYNVPEGGTIVLRNKSRRTPNVSTSFNAYAGNVTRLSITGNSISQSWQAYFGNITGTISLQNSANNKIFGWNNVYPTGEIYATELSSVNWTSANLQCYSFTTDSTIYLSLPEYEGWGTNNGPAYSGMGLARDDPDGVDETFSNASANGHTSFYTGIKYFNGSTTGANIHCPRAKLYNSSGVPGQYEEVIIYAVKEARPVFTSIILKYGARGFDGKTWDFEMLVPENGHNGNSATTTYYFYMELQ
jgi:hypothetical protein